MSITLPSDLTYGLVTGRFLKVVADGADSDQLPEGAPFSDLTITFQASPIKMLSKSSKTLFLPEAVECSTDAYGYLIDPQGNRGVYLVATDQDSLALNPSDFTYTVTVKQKFTTLDSFSFTVPGGSEQDLSDISPIPSSTGVAIVRGEQGIQGPIGPAGPSGGPVPNMTGVPAGQTVNSLGAGAAEWTSPIDFFALMGVI